MHKSQIIRCGKHLYNKNLTVATSGNISLKTDNGIFITASGTSLGYLQENDIVLTDFNGQELTYGKASSEKLLHCEIYKQRPEINAIIHSHPVYLTSFAACHKSLNDPIMSENVLYFEEIPVAEYAMPSSIELVENTMKYLINHDVVLMANHGVIVIADTMQHAFSKLETAEYYAQVTINTILLGGAKNLSDNDVKNLIKLKRA